MNGFYDNTGYVNKRNRKQILILDVSDEGGDIHLGNGSEFNIQLREPLIIDSLSEVYLDNMVTFNCNMGDESNQSAFVLNIDQFNINNSVASPSDTFSNIVSGSIIIPNDNNNIDNYFGPVIHKAKKFNYLCDINPCKISNISGKITDLSGAPIFHGTDTQTTRKYTYALVGIDSWDTTTNGPQRALVKGETVTSIEGSGTTYTEHLRILANTIVDASIIYFTSTQSIPTDNFGSGDITFSMPANSNPSRAIYVFKLTRSANPSMMLIQGDSGRFISEFSIVSRE
jgi:hypothetical protein